MSAMVYVNGGLFNFKYYEGNLQPLSQQFIICLNKLLKN